MKMLENEHLEKPNALLLGYWWALTNLRDFRRNLHMQRLLFQIFVRVVFKTAIHALIAKL